MKSPFPGMDPYLEDPAYWEGFHHMFIAEAVVHLSERLPEPYIADPTERVHLVSVHDDAAPQYVPDVLILEKLRRGERRRALSSTPPPGGDVATLEPVEIPQSEGIEVREQWIEVRRMPDRELVTAIELLSPANKYGEGVGAYRSKRHELVAGGVHVVEIDLLRRGTRTSLARPLPDGDYYTFLFFGDRRPNVNVYAWPLRRALPVLPIPLRAPDPDVFIDLGAVVSNTYVRSQYRRKVDYGRPVPPPSLSADDARWATELIVGAGA